MFRPKRFLLYIFSLAFLIAILVWQLDVPTDEQRVLEGVLLRGYYTTPRLGPALTRMTVSLSTGGTVDVTGPPTVRVHVNDRIFVTEKRTLITGRRIYEFRQYVREP